MGKKFRKGFVIIQQFPAFVKKIEILSGSESSELILGKELSIPDSYEKNLNDLVNLTDI